MYLVVLLSIISSYFVAAKIRQKSESTKLLYNFLHFHILYDLQGREVGKDARGLVIMKQGNVVKKVMK
jgi:hypothetical protein